MSKAKKKSILVKSKKLMTNPETRVLMKLRDSIMRNKKNFFRIELAKSSEVWPDLPISMQLDGGIVLLVCSNIWCLNFRLTLWIR